MFHSLNKSKEQIKILIAKTESKLLILFGAYLSSLGMRTETVSSGHEAVYQFLKSKEKRPYDAIVLDTHLNHLLVLMLLKNTFRKTRPKTRISDHYAKRISIKRVLKNCRNSG